ncbi:MAG TPA: glycosyltransferase [Candidatus Dormibacteraeota bacterium]|nr:glycosyltransferase [Candidatus Dormibacteraeota bacterium]
MVVPTLNSASTLHWTLCALHSQRGVTLNVIVADSGSTDATLELCKHWSVRTIYVPPGNMYRAINAGLREIDSEWVTYLNSDDVVYPSSYARLLARGEEKKACLVYGDCDFVDYEGRFLFMQKSPPAPRLAGLARLSPVFKGRLGFTQPTAIYRRIAFEELNGFDEVYRFFSDVDFFYRFITSGRPAAKLPRPTVAAFRLHNKQLSVRQASSIQEEMRRFRKATTIRPMPADWLDVLSWRLLNSPVYLWRLSRLRP